MGERNNGRRISAGLVIVAAVLVLILIPAAPVFSEFPAFSEELSPNPVGRGGRFTHTIILDLENPERVSIELPDLPEGLRLYRGPAIVPIWEQLESGAYVRKVRIRTTFTADRAGKTVLGGFLLRVEDENAVTGYHLVRVGLWQDRRLVVPYEPEWTVPETPVYTGQAVPVVLTVRNMEKVTLFDRVTVNQPTGAMFERVSGIGSIESRTIGDITLYDIPAAGYMLTPSSPGVIVLPEAGVEVEDVSGRSGKTRIEVLPLPQEVRTTGAVGSFVYRAEFHEGDALEGRELELKIRLTGTGNLNFLEIPDPSVSGLSLVSRKDDGNFRPDDAGYSGYREITYLYLPVETGQAAVETRDLHVLEPRTGRVNILRGQRFDLQIAPASVEAGEEAGPPPFPFEPVYSERSRIFSGPGFSSSPWWYCALLPGPLVLLIFLIIRKKPGAAVFAFFLVLSGCAFEPEFRETLSEAAEAYRAQHYNQAADLYRAALRQKPHEAVAAYNYALSCYRNGDIIEGIQASRHAVYQAPLFFRARSMLKWVEERNEIPGGSMLQPVYHPDIFFLLLALGVNGASLFALLRMFRKRGVYTIIAILFLSLSVPAGIFLWYSSGERNNPSGIVYRENVHLSKIPSESAAPWVPVQMGAAVKVLQEARGYYLVRDGRGTEGWVPAGTLVLDSDLVFLLDHERVHE